TGRVGRFSGTESAGLACGPRMIVDPEPEAVAAGEAGAAGGVAAPGTPRASSEVGAPAVGAAPSAGWRGACSSVGSLPGAPGGITAPPGGIAVPPEGIAAPPAAGGVTAPG